MRAAGTGGHSQESHRGSHCALPAASSACKCARASSHISHAGTGNLCSRDGRPQPGIAKR
eukprot:1158032-Pelagomonas_calceolata.AAC.1